MLDEVDRKILSILAKNARTPLLEIAKQVGMSNTAVKKRLKKLEENGIILGYCVKLNKQMFREPTFLHILHVPNDGLPEFMKALLSIEGVEHAFHNAVGKTHIIYLFFPERSLPPDLLKFCTSAMVSRVEEVV